jgi:hypothetical protein
MTTMRHIRFIMILFLIFWACSEEESALLNEDLLFTNAFQIKVPGYQYNVEGTTYTVRGDTSYLSSVTDTLNSMPVFRWDSMDINILTVAIFTNSIDVRDNEIKNTEDIIWQWHSGMENGKEGYVQYSDGRNVLHGTMDTIDYQHPATPLDAGLYYWAVWGWNQSGIRIWYSSRELKFYVSN